MAFASGAMTRRHTPHVRLMNDGWWFENVYWSWQDQLSLPYIVAGTPGLKWNTNMPWAKWWGYQEHGT